MMKQTELATGYSLKGYTVTGRNAFGGVVVRFVVATCRWRAILEGRALGITETISCIEV